MLSHSGDDSPSNRQLKRGLVYHLCSRLNNMSIIGISTSPSYLLLVQQIAPSLIRPPPPRHPPPCLPSPPAPLWIMNDFPTVCHASYLSPMKQGKYTALWYVMKKEMFNLLSDIFFFILLRLQPIIGLGKWHNSLYFHTILRLQRWRSGVGQ